MIICQNCDTNFPTKYQYQRHQCEFNADKVVLKPNVDIKDIDKGMRMKFDCPTCGKQFVSKNNLERHQTSHDETNINVCEHCNKQFVSENRLRIHKENHCKKAGDISKFYRSDVTVWKCLSCYQVFATPSSASKHTENCVDNLNWSKTKKSPVEDDDCKIIADDGKCLTSSEILDSGITLNGKVNDAITNRNVQKFLTELLLQCEYCNRTYADKKWLLLHQKSHTTTVNYECITCNLTFDSYVLASKHWLTKCSDEANLFYLPKLTYCEYCDRTFKSHEILYTHKFKKKHYTPKIYSLSGSNPTDIKQEALKDNSMKIIENKEAIVKLIEDVLFAMNVSTENKQSDSSNLKETSETTQNSYSPEIVIKSEVYSESSSFNKSDTSQDSEKKKRGRKRKSPRQTMKTKRLSVVVENGYKYQCEKCVKVFDSVADLENHREIEHPAKFKCEECGQVVHSAKALLIHSRAHQSLKPYVCEICKRCYSQTSHLWQHMRFHQGIKPFACPHEGCEARYTIRPDLKDHIRKVHTRERPFKCSVCDKCFLTGSVYYQHRLIHTNDRRYGCDVSITFISL
ncbi:zinc finger protein [Holotrichia oblita]|uniref:Zinc finger protein n=1 Tax=Holotrichia oblita TaxID=644536 RepID=A0ACB9TNS6_HOLOL|nr:zinc finger protein [Holotrichia oblita]